MGPGVLCRELEGANSGGAIRQEGCFLVQAVVCEVAGMSLAHPAWHVPLTKYPKHHGP